MQSDVVFRPEHLVQTGLGTDRLAGREPRRIGVREQLVRPRPDQGIGDPIASARVLPALAPQPHEPIGGSKEAPGRPEREPPLVPCSRHSDTPPVARLTDDVCVGHEDPVEEQLGERGLPVEPPDGPHGHPGCPQVEHQVGQALMGFGRVRVRTEDPEGTVGERGPRRPGLLPGQQPAPSVRTALDLRDARSEPASGSDQACAQIVSPLAMDGSTRARCSGVPWSKRVGASRLMPFCETRPGAPAA